MDTRILSMKKAYSLLMAKVMEEKNGRPHPTKCLPVARIEEGRGSGERLSYMYRRLNLLILNISFCFK